MSPHLLRLRRARAVKLAREIAKETGIPSRLILGRERDPEVCAARHLLWLRLHETGLSINSVATVTGFDHTSVLYGIRKLQCIEVGL